MADRFNILTKYITQLSNANFGEWVIDRENEGTPEHPIQIPSVDYSSIVDAFIEDVYRFVEANKDMELNKYIEILSNNRIEWDSESMKCADVSSLDAQCVMALIVGAVRAERFCDGALLAFFRDGSIIKWLLQLKEIGGA